MQKICIALILAIIPLSSVLAAEENQQYGTLRREAVVKLDALREATARAAQDGIDVERERVTITTAELFLLFADWDKNHPDELEAAIAAWWRVRDDAPRLAMELPVQEINDLVKVLNSALKELDDVVQGKITRRKSVLPDMRGLEERNGYYYQNGRPVFPSSFVWQPSSLTQPSSTQPGEDKIARAYGDIGGKYIHLPHIRVEGGKPTIDVDSSEDEPLGYIFMGQSHVPGWLKKKYPEITDGEHHYTGFDTDHPAARQLWADMLADLVPRFADRKISQAGYLLTNEPHWFTSTDGWAKGPVSARTKAKFRQWLQRRHSTIDVLNALWETDFNSFADVTIDIPIDSNLRGKPIWYDWCRFNMDRINEWFAFLRNEIQRHDGDAKTHIKLIPRQFADGTRCHGLDFESLVRLQEIIGCDAGIVKTPHWKIKEAWTDRYACRWRDQALPLDFFRSISPEKLVFDSEWHGLSTVNIRDPFMPPQYVRCALWLAHLHGTGMNQTWYWSREKDGSVKRKSDSGFYASNLTQPLVMDAYGRTMKELNAFAPEVVALATEPKRIRFFYSEAAAIQDQDYMEHLYEAYQSLYHQGMPLGFVTERILNETAEDKLKQWPVIIVTHADHVTANDRGALERYMGQGGNLLVIGEKSLKYDPYGRPFAPTKADDDRLVSLKNVTDDILITELKKRGLSPSTTLIETNAIGLPGCVWRTTPWKDGQLLLIINLGKTSASIELDSRADFQDLTTGNRQPARFYMDPFDVKLLYLSNISRLTQ